MTVRNQPGQPKVMRLCFDSEVRTKRSKACLYGSVWMKNNTACPVSSTGNIIDMILNTLL